MANLDRDRLIDSLINRQSESVNEIDHSSDKFSCESPELKIYNSDRSTTEDRFHKGELQVRYNSGIAEVNLTYMGRSMGEIW